MLEQLIAIAMDSIEVKYQNFKTYLISQKQSFNEAVSTGAKFNYPEISRDQSSKSVNPTTYDRYKKYHYPLGTVFKLGNVIEIVICTIKKVFVFK